MRPCYLCANIPGVSPICKGSPNRLWFFSFSILTVSCIFIDGFDTGCGVPGDGHDSAEADLRVTAPPGTLDHSVIAYITRDLYRAGGPRD